MVNVTQGRLCFNQEFVFTGSWISVSFSKLDATRDTTVFIKGPLGESSLKIKSSINAQIIRPNGENDKRAGIYFSSVNKSGAALIGTYASIVRQNSNGLIKPFSAFVEVRGLGYKIRCLSSKAVEFTVGYSHVCLYEVPDSVKVQAVGAKSRVIELTSPSWLALRQTVADMKLFKPAGVYTERGIYEKDEHVKCKDGKKKKFG